MQKKQHKQNKKQKQTYSDFDWDNWREDPIPLVGLEDLHLPFNKIHFIDNA